MTMLTVDDLARDLKVRNEDLLRELVMMGYDVEGPESPLETDDPAALRAQLTTVLPQREVVEKRIKPTVIRRRMKNMPPETAPEETPPHAAMKVEQGRSLLNRTRLPHLTGSLLRQRNRSESLRARLENPSLHVLSKWHRNLRFLLYDQSGSNRLPRRQRMKFRR